MSESIKDQYGADCSSTPDDVAETNQWESLLADHEELEIKYKNVLKCNAELKENILTAKDHLTLASIFKKYSL